MRSFIECVPNFSEGRNSARIQELVAAMSDFIREVPRTWQEVLERFAGQPYPKVYRAFGALRPTLGRMANASPNFPYTFSESGDFVEGTK